MSYLRRKADIFLENWKRQDDKLPLIISGARQVGKTETIRNFAKNNYKNIIEINFITSPEYKTITEGGYSVGEIIKRISLINPSLKFSCDDTIIFFDEIQDFPDIATSLKFFKSDGRFDVICSGSLLGIQYKAISSISVGYKKDYTMRSMDFEEFLWAKGYDETVIDGILQHMISFTPFDNTEMRIFSQLFFEYCILGGMPEIVSSYIEKESFEGSLDMQRQLIRDYESDARKYAEGLDQSKIIGVYRSIPAQLAKKNKKFQYNKVSTGGRSKDYMGCVEWLTDTGLVNRCSCMQFPELPIKGNICENKFKLYFADTGLLVASLDDEAQLDVRANKNLGVYKGALYENFASEALVKQDYPLCYYSRENSTLEEDFFVRSANELIPIEVKANSNKARSLSLLIESERYPDIKHGIKFANSNIGYEKNIATFPHFCMFLLRKFILNQKEFT